MEWKKTNNGDRYCVSERTGYVYEMLKLIGFGKRKETDMVCCLLAAENEEAYINEHDGFGNLDYEYDDDFPGEIIGWRFDVNEKNYLENEFEWLINWYEDQQSW